MEILRKNQNARKKKGKKNVAEMKNAFDGLSVRLDMAEERISELRYISIEYLS